MNLAILGFGTVGRGVYDMANALNWVKVSKILVREHERAVSNMVSSIDDIVDDDKIDTVVECIGGVHPVYEYALKCIKKGKNFVTSNKMLVAEYGLELQKEAKKTNASFLFSAACGGAIPILHNVSIASKSDEILKCSGILNGTTNFIITKMIDENVSYEDALKDAQKRGFAEADPSSDVSGKDTLRKVILLSCISFKKMPNDGFCVEGIEHFSSSVVKKIKEKNLDVKLMGFCGKTENGGIYAYVEPVVLKPSTLEAAIKSNINFASYEAKNSGRISLIGQGAGRYPSASNVLRDLSAVNDGVKNMMENDCVAVRADNDDLQCAHPYIIIHNDKVEITDAMSVKKMHEHIKMLRRGESNIFFAQYRI